ncbi:MAG: hypothetical protein GX444_09910 [Myxococcales bacterium]|nr:hypothetical protein [Myxococcales bacterium]
MRIRLAIALVFLFTLYRPASVFAAKCNRVLPEEVFQYFGDKSGKADCGDYEYKLVDLNGDEQLEITVTNYRRSCEDVGYCTFEIFEKKGDKWLHVGSIPGRIRLLETKTNGYYDIATWLLGHRYVYIWDGNTYRDIMHSGGETKKSESKSPDSTPPPTPVPQKPAPEIIRPESGPPLLDT